VTFKLQRYSSFGKKHPIDTRHAGHSSVECAPSEIPETIHAESVEILNV
jgi:hypothetical protein